MAKTLKIQAGEKSVAYTIMIYAHQIWLAGLGAFARAEREGSKLFEALVKEGEKAEARSKKTAEKKAAEAQEMVEEAQDKAKELKDRASGTWNKLEQVFQNRVARALNRLGVPTHEDVRSLAKQVEALNENINDLIKSRREKLPLKEEETHVPTAEVTKTVPALPTH